MVLVQVLVYIFHSKDISTVDDIQMITKTHLFCSQVVCSEWLNFHCSGKKQENYLC